MKLPQEFFLAIKEFLDLQFHAYFWNLAKGLNLKHDVSVALLFNLRCLLLKSNSSMGVHLSCFRFSKASQVLGGSYSTLTISSFLGFPEGRGVRGRDRC
jgi:hypothetical protein